MFGVPPRIAVPTTMAARSEVVALVAREIEHVPDERAPDVRPLAHLRLAAGTTPWYAPPALIADHARTLVVLLAIPLALPVARRRTRTVDDALAVLRGLADGSIDAIATDHAPHPPERTLVEFAETAPGMIGLETALSIGLAAVDAGCLSLAALLTALSTGPAALIGEERGLGPGTSADMVVGINALDRIIFRDIRKS